MALLLGSGSDIVQYGVAILFAWAFAVQAGLPLPAAPVLLGAGPAGDVTWWVNESAEIGTCDTAMNAALSFGMSAARPRARQLRISKSTLYVKVKKYGLDKLVPDARVGSPVTDPAFA